MNNKNRLLLITYDRFDLNNIENFFNKLKINKSVESLNFTLKKTENDEDILNYWIDKKSVFSLDYLSDVNNKIVFFFMYSNPYNLLSEYLEKGLEGNELFIESKMNEWIEYYSIVLDYYINNPEQCILLHKFYFEERYLSYISCYLRKVNFNIELSKKIFHVDKKLIDKNKLNENKLDNLRENITAVTSVKLFDKAISIYDKLQSLSSRAYIEYDDLLKVDDTKNQAFQSEKDLIFPEISCSNDILELKEENELLQMQLYILQEELERYSKTKQVYQPKKIKPIGAANVIKNQLTYRVGSIIISNSKSLLGLLSLPYKVYREIKVYKKNNSNKNLSIDDYIDIKEGEKVKEHLTYKLGDVYLKNIKSLSGSLRMPWILNTVVKKHKKEKK